MKTTYLTLVILLIISNVYAQQWKNIPVETLNRYNFLCLKDSTGVDVNELGSGSFGIRKIIKIQTPKGALIHRVLKYDYDPLTAFAKFKSVKVIKPTGEIIHFPVDSACDYAAPARAIYWGARQIMIELGQLEPGDIIDYEVSKKGFTYALLTANDEEDRFVPPMRGEFYDIVPFWCSEPTAKKIYRVSMPKSKEIQYEFYQGEAQSSIRLEGDRKIYTFITENQLPTNKEPNMVDLFDVAPKLMMSTTPTWKDKSAWFYKVNEDYGSFAAEPEAQKKVDALIKSAKTEMEKISILTHWVADNMRYSGISMGKGEGFTLHNTKMNFTDRCGVCKDKAALLISMLRMAGFEAYPAMTMAGSRVETIPADHFNHSVAVVKLSNGTYMPLDPTWVPFLRELWSSAEQQQNYLPGIPERSDLLVTPLSAPENHYFYLDIESTLDKEGGLHGTFVVRAEGQSDATVRRPFTSGMKQNWKAAMEKELMNIAAQAQLLSVDYGKNPRDYMSGPIKITMKFYIPDYARVGDDVMIFLPVSSKNLYRGVRSFLNIDTSLKERQYGFKDACSRLVGIQEKIILPKGYKMTTKNKEVNEIKDVSSYKGSVIEKNKSIEIKHEVIMTKRVYDAKDWQAVKSAIGAYKDLLESQIIIKKSDK